MWDSLFITLGIMAVGMGAFYAYRWVHMRQALQHLSEQSTDIIRQDLLGYQPDMASVVLFTADYCAPCKLQQRPILKQLRQQWDNIQVLEVNVEENPQLAEAWGVMSLPTTFVLDKQGKPHGVNHGVASLQKLHTQLQAVV